MTYPEWNPTEHISAMVTNGVGGAVSLNFDSEEDKKLSVVFFTDDMLNEQKSKAAGRPIYDPVERCEIRIPGSPDVQRPVVTDKERQRFPRQYAAFKAATSQDAVSGTPLKEWPWMSTSQVKELAHFGIRTVEHLAGLADGAIQQLGPGWLQMRQHARDWLLKAESSAPLVALRAENESLKQRLETLEGMVQRQAQEIAASREGVTPAATPAPAVDIAAMVREQLAAVLAAQAPAPKRRGRPPKVRPPEES